ncbi:hypothetical protein ACOMHN_002871 [Nucella lapillus]
METRERAMDERSVSSSISQGHVLITQGPEDDESVHTMTHSDARSEGGATLHSHVIDSPIPEEEEEEEEEVVDGRLSHRSDHSHVEVDNVINDNDPSLLNGHARRGSEEEEEEEEEEDESYVDSMSMDNVSDTFSIASEPKELKDEDFDTDLDMDDDKWLNPEKYDHDTTGLTKYLNACEEHDVTPVRYFIKHMLEDTMNLGHHGLGPAAMKALAVPLESNTSIEHLDLEGNWLEKEGVTHLCRVLKENVYIVHLSLAENKMGNDGTARVLDLLEENRTIEYLNLTGNQITDNLGENLYNMLKSNTTLRHLYLRHNELGDRGAQWLKDSLAENERLLDLDISWNHFQTRGCVLVAEGLKENVGLKEVNLSMNGFGMEGADSLGEAIKVNRTLLKVDASYCRLPVEGAASFASGLQVNETLQHLNVGYNSLGPEGTLAILIGLERHECSGLLLLDLGNTKVTRQFKDLQDKLEGERPLRVHHGGVMLDTLLRELPVDPWGAFKKDPMTKLKEWVASAGYRLIDLLRHFDKDNSMTISREEFIHGIKSINIDITDEQIEILLKRLDSDGDGEIDFRPWFSESELIQGDNDHRSLKREIHRIEEDQKRLRDEETGTDLESFLRMSPVPP